MESADQHEEVGRFSATLDVDAELVDNIVALIDEELRPMVMNIVADLHPADIGQILTHIKTRDARRLFAWLPADLAADVIANLDDDYRTDLLEDVSDDRLAAVLDELDTDDAADVLADLPEPVAERLLPVLEDSEELEALLEYDEESAGGLMAREFVAVQPDWTVEEATEEVRRNAETVEEVFVLFVVDELFRLRGFVSLKRLLLSPADAGIGDIMNTEPVSVTTDVDQEDVARIMERYDLISLPVTDADGVLLGRVTIDDIVDVLREEAEEDMQRMSGVAGGEEPTASAFRISRGRLPWLLVGLAGAGLAAAVILSFEHALRASAVLAGFIPIVMATAGNAGIQSSAIAVQGIASGDIWASDILSRIGKEVVVSVINGVVAAIILALGIMLIAQFQSALVPDPGRLAFTAGLALTLVIILATTIGATIPLLLDKAGIDPALATGPFITTSNDILGILVFFLLAEALYL